MSNSQKLSQLVPGGITPIPVNKGGTGTASLTGLVKGNGTGALTAAVSGTDIKTVNGDSILGAGDISVATLETNTFTGLQTDAAGADIASATTINLTTATGNTVVIAGTVATSALTMTAGQQMVLLPSGAWPMTYNATTMNINGGVDQVCAAGDRVTVVRDLAGVIRVTLVRQSGVAVVAPITGNARNYIASGAITAAGKAVIVNNDGTVSQSIIVSASVTSPTTFRQDRTEFISNTYVPVEDKFVIFYRDPVNLNYGTAVVVTLTGTTPSFGTPVVFASHAVSQIASTYDPIAEKAVFAYADASGNGQVRVCSITGTVPSFGAPSAIGAALYNAGMCFDKSVNRILLMIRNTNIRAYTGLVSGTSIAISGASASLYGSTNGYTMAVVHCDSIAKNVYCYNDGGRSQIATVQINPTTFAVTAFGTYTFVSGNTGANGYSNGERCLAWNNSLNQIGVLHGGGPALNYVLHFTTHTHNGTQWTFRAFTTVSGSFFSAPYEGLQSVDFNATTGDLAITYPDASNTYNGKLRFSTGWTSNAISFTGEFQYQSTFTEFTSLASNGIKGNVMVAYRADSGTQGLANPGPGRVAVGTAPLLDKRAQFIGFAQAAAIAGESVSVQLPFGRDSNQAGLTVGTTYYLSSGNGSALTTTISGQKVARAVSTTEILVLGDNNY